MYRETKGIRRDEADPNDQPLQGRSPRVQLPPLRTVQDPGELGQGSLRRLGSGRDPIRLFGVLSLHARGAWTAERRRGHGGLQTEGWSRRDPERLQGRLEEAL